MKAFLKNGKTFLAMLLVGAMSVSMAACTTPAETGEGTTSAATEAAETGEATEAEGTTGGAATELVVNVGPNPDTIDPALNSAVDGATLIIHAFEGLYSLDQSGVPVPGQAESVDISEDGMTYTFHLREGLKWSDGTPLTASDFVYSWNRAILPETAADYGYMFESIQGYADGELAVTAVDDLTLEVKLIARTPYFLELAAFPAYFPVNQAVVEANADAWATAPETYVSNGPYTMTEWVYGSHITYVKNENYWNVEALGPESIKFVLIEDNNASLAAYESGEVKFIDAVPNDEIERLKADGEFKIEGQIGTYYVSYNVGVEPLNDAQFRKALTLAVDRDYITKTIGQAGQVNAGAYASIGIGDAEPGVEFREVGGDYYDPSPEAYEANLEEAKAIMAELYPDGDIPTVEYIYNEDTGHQLIGEALQQMWAELGVEVTLQVQEWSTFLNTRKNQEYQIARNGWLNDYNDPIGMLDMWITGGGNNDAGWSNAEYDALIKAVKESGDQEERMRMMHEAEDILFEEWVLCPIYYYVDVFMLDESIADGFYSSPLGFKYFMYVNMQ